MSVASVDLNRVPLGPEKRQAYFNEVTRAFTLIEKVYAARKESGLSEGALVGKYLERFLGTMLALSLKYCYSDGGEWLKIDVTDSGFVHFYELARLHADLENRGSELLNLPRPNALKSEILDHMFTGKEDPVDLISQLARRYYFDGLDADKLFLEHNHGELGVEGKGEASLYYYHWSCYDSETNRPYIYIMLFEESGRPRPMAEDKKRFEVFKQAIKAEGSRAPKLNVVAAAIDDRLVDIHPKVLKRIGIGPLYSEAFSINIPEDLRRVLSHAVSKDRFAFCMDHEQLVSTKQVTAKGLFSKERLREIFFVPGSEGELFDRGVSSLQSYVLLNHTLHQHAQAVLKDRRIISFDSRGTLHGI